MEKLKKYFTNKYCIIPITIIMTITIMYCFSCLFFDNDGYFILATGKYIVNNGHIPKINPFTFIYGLEIVIQQWLWCVITWLSYSTLGNLGIYILCCVLLLINIFIAIKIGKLKDVDINTAIIISLTVFFLIFNFINIRPTLVSTALLLIQIYAIEKYIKTNNKKILLLLPIISLLEINLHSALWFMHFVFLLPYIVPPIKNPFVKFKEKTYSIKPILLFSIPMFLMGFLNPYGIDGMAYFINSYGDKLNNLGINELTPFCLNDFYGIIIIIYTFLILHKIIKTEIVNSISFYFFCGCTILGYMCARNAVYLFIGSILILFDFIKDINMNRIFEKSNKNTIKLTWLLVIFAIIFTIPMIEENINFEVKDCQATPVKAIEYLNAHADKDAIIYTDFNNGGYFEYNDYKIFIDARPELYFEKINKAADIIDEFSSLRTVKSAKTFEDFILKYNFDYLCINTYSIFDFYMQTREDYVVVVESKGYKFYEKIIK